MAQRTPVQRGVTPSGTGSDRRTHRDILLSLVMRRQGAGVTRGRLGSRVATIWVLHVGRLTLPGTQLPNVGLP